MRTIEDLLAAADAFDGLSAEWLELLAGCGRNCSFADGDLLLREGEPAESFYVLHRGTVALEVHAPARGAIVIETIQEGDLLGWSWLVPPYRTRIDARAVGHVSAVSFDAPCIRGKCEADPAFGYTMLSRFAQIIVERLQATRLRLLDVYGHAG
jgi:CRP/FNR family cyclic AMP-dependent transcriptional regulator